MRLNLAEYSFVLGGVRFLGFLLTQRDIETNPNQIKSIQNITALKCLKELQALAGSIATLRHFIPQSSKKYFPMYDKIKEASKHNSFIWTKYCEDTLQNIKDFLTLPPIMSETSLNEPLKLYLSAVTLQLLRYLSRKLIQIKNMYTTHVTF